MYDQKNEGDIENILTAFRDARLFRKYGMFPPRVQALGSSDTNGSGSGDNDVDEDAAKEEVAEEAANNTQHSNFTVTPDFVPGLFSLARVRVCVCQRGRARLWL